MGTTEDKEESKAAHHGLLKTMEKAKQAAIAAAIIVAFLQGGYAAYFKPESEARSGFEATTRSVEEFSGQVDLKVAKLQGRVALLEKLVLRNSYREAPAAPVPVAAAPVALAPAPALVPAAASVSAPDRVFLEDTAPVPVLAAAVPEMSLPDAGPPALPVAAVAAVAAPVPVEAEADDMPEQKSAGIKYEAPKAPWKKKK